ncbi:hypothetical protein [Caproiciproducens sp.]
MDKAMQGDIKSFLDFISEAVGTNNNEGLMNAVDELKKKCEKVIEEEKKAKEKSMPEFRNVLSLNIAESLIVDWGLMKQLSSIIPNSHDSTKRIYVFKNSPELSMALDQLIAESREYKKKRKQENLELDKALKDNKNNKGEKSNEE